MVVDDDQVDLNKVPGEEIEVKDNGPPSASLFCEDHYLKLVFNDKSDYKIFKKEKGGQQKKDENMKDVKEKEFKG